MVIFHIFKKAFVEFNNKIFQYFLLFTGQSVNQSVSRPAELYDQITQFNKTSEISFTYFALFLKPFSVRCTYQLRHPVSLQ